MKTQTTSTAPPDWAIILLQTIGAQQGVLSLEFVQNALKGVTVSPSHILGTTRFDEEFYTRTSIFCTSFVEVLVMGWLPGQMSPLHNHKGSICAVEVLAGNALELSYERSEAGYLVPKEVARFATGSVTVSEDEEVHQFGNGSEAPMVSLHVYSPPLHSAEIFSESESVLSGNALQAMTPNHRASTKEIALPLVL